MLIQFVNNGKHRKHFKSCLIGKDLQRKMAEQCWNTKNYLEFLNQFFFVSGINQEYIEPQSQ